MKRSAGAFVLAVSLVAWQAPRGELRGILPRPVESKPTGDSRSDPHAGVVAYYRFESDKPGLFNSVTQASDGELNAVRVNAPSLLVVPLTGDANEFALDTQRDRGSAACRTKFSFHSGGDATLEFWVYPGEPGHASVFWTRSDAGDVNRFNIYTERGMVGCDYRSPGGALHELLPMGKLRAPVKEWTHIAIVRAGNTYRFHENGKLVHEGRDADPDLPTSVGWLLAGRRGFEFRGRVDEIRLTTKALRASEFLLFAR